MFERVDSHAFNEFGARYVKLFRLECHMLDEGLEHFEVDVTAHCKCSL